MLWARTPHFISWVIVSQLKVFLPLISVLVESGHRNLGVNELKKATENKD